MCDNKKMSQFTIVNIIERKIHFTNTNTIFDKAEYQDNDEGELLVYIHLI